MSALFAQEPLLGTLQSVSTNTRQIFTLSNHNFVCKTYGITGINKLSNSNSLNNVCKKKIESFSKKNPDAFYFSTLQLHPMQRYHIEFINSECVLYAKGKTTLGEVLLQEGLAVLTPAFKDREFLVLYRKAQMRAKIEKKGIWRDGVIRDCIAEIYK